MNYKSFIFFVLLITIITAKWKGNSIFEEGAINHYITHHQKMAGCLEPPATLIQMANCVNETIYKSFGGHSSFHFLYTNLSFYGDATEIAASFYRNRILDEQVIKVHWVLTPIACTYPIKVNGSTFIILNSYFIFHALSSTVSVDGLVRRNKEYSQHTILYKKNKDAIFGVDQVAYAFGGGAFKYNAGPNQLADSPYYKVSSVFNPPLVEGDDAYMIFRRDDCTLNPNGFDFYHDFVNKYDSDDD